MNKMEAMLVEGIVRGMSGEAVEEVVGNLRKIEKREDAAFNFPRARMAERIRLFVESIHTPQRP